MRPLVLLALGAAVLALASLPLLRAAETPADVLEAVVGRTGVAGGVVAWGAPGGPPQVVATGYADRAAGRAMRPDDRFPVASLTKPVTAALVLAQVDAGRFRLETPLADLDPAAPPGVTVGQALSHFGGWDRRDGGDPYFRPVEDLSRLGGGGPITDCRDVAILPDVAPTLPPGRVHVYSNIGYCWLGEIIPPPGYAAAVDALGFDLDPRRTTVVPEPLDPGTADWAVMQPGMAGPFGGIVSDAAGFLSFALRPVDDRTLAEPPVPWERNYYGLGWRVWPRDRATYLTHYGSLPGVFSFVIRRRDGGAAVLLLNGYVEDHERLAEALAETFIALPGWQ